MKTEYKILTVVIAFAAVVVVGILALLLFLAFQQWPTAILAILTIVVLAGIMYAGVSEAIRSYEGAKP